MDLRVDTPEDAEQLAARWMKAHGYRDAKVTGAGSDRGIDVASSGGVAQVKFWVTKKVARPDVQMLEGAARGRDAMFFSYSGYSGPAIEWAEEGGIALLVFDEQGTVTPINAQAELALRLGEGLGPPLSASQRAMVYVACWLIGGAIALIATLGAFSLWSAGPDCQPLYDSSSQACDVDLLGGLLLWFGGASVGLLVGGLPALILPKWQKSRDDIARQTAAHE